MHDRGAFVVGVASVDFLVGHGRKRVESVVLDVAFFQHKQLVVFDHINEGFLTVFPLHKQVRAVLRRPFLQPHVVVDAWRNDIAPPMVSEFMAEQVAIGDEPFTHHELRVSDVGGDFEGAVGGQHIPDAFPGVRPPPVFQGVDGEAQFLEFGDHGPDVLGFARKAHGHVTVCSGVHVIRVHVRRYRDGGLVGCDGVSQLEAALNGVAGQYLFADEVALAMGRTSAGTGDVVGVGGALDKVVKTRVPHLAKIGWDGGQPDAQIVDVVAHEIKPAPVRILVGRALVPYIDGVDLLSRPAAFRRIDVHL